jgi:hypothetical protein
VKDFLDALGSPLGIIVWDEIAQNKYKMIKEECRRVAVPGVGVSYRQMQYILCLYAMAEDPATEPPLEDKENREQVLLEYKTAICAAQIQALWRGKIGRRLLGVTNVASGKSDADRKSDAFKKRFANMMSNPAKVGVLSLPKPAAAVPSAASVGVLGVGPASPEMATDPPPSADVAASGAAEVRNVFRERAAQRMAAKQARGS